VKTKGSTKRADLHHLLDVRFRIVAEFGTLRMPLYQMVELQSRGLLELDRAPDGHIDLYIEDQKIARGEVLAMNGRYAVRITEIVEQRRARPHFSPLPTSPVQPVPETPHTRIEDLISIDDDADANDGAVVYESSIADAYEFPTLDEIEASRRTRHDEPTMGPVDHASPTYSPRRSVPHSSQQPGSS